MGGYVNFEEVNRLLDEINNDRTVPRNVKECLKRAREDLNNEKLDATVRISSAISLLDEVANDPNMPIYARTQVWNIVSMLESMNKK